MQNPAQRILRIRRTVSESYAPGTSRTKGFHERLSFVYSAKASWPGALAVCTCLLAPL